MKRFAAATVTAAAALGLLSAAAQASYSAYGVTYDAKEPVAFSSYQMIASYSVVGTPTVDVKVASTMQRCIVNTVGSCNWTNQGSVQYQTYLRGQYYNGTTSYFRDMTGGCHKYRMWVRISAPTAQPVDYSAVRTLCRI